ncbi:hypothetical protein RGQ13_03320 [Thalassotalea psychrophila]|uniref:Lipoprotein n=1 Tax=Thalassotalea psychrophila TaxID=3065647 RepID=A0ABY9TW09_9GAMM|nr:hypothetical protein RGQ13_03320 [Colwelliaceae bacterium SQ149]
MSKFIRLSSLTSLILLTACGSGGGGGDDEDNKPPASYSFTVQSLIKNSCGETSAYADAQVFLQDENWQVISEHPVDNEGLVEINSTNDKINFTILAAYKGDNGIESYQAVSYYQVDTDIKATYYATHADKLDNSTCECITQDVVLSHINSNNIQNAISSAEFESYELVDGVTTTFKQVESCKVKGQEWAEHSFAVYDLEEGFVGFHQDFSATDNGSWQVFDNGSGIAVSFNRKDMNMTTSQIFNQTRHFTKTALAETNETIIFENHKFSGETLYSASADFIFKEESSPFGSVSLKSRETVFSQDYNESLAVKPSEDDENIDYITWAEIEASGAYDYSKVSKHKMAVISYIFDAKNPDTELDMPVLWTSYGPIEGQLPMNTLLPGFEDIVDGDTDIDVTRVNLLRHHSFDNYQEYINYYTNLGHADVSQQMDKTNDTVHQYFVELVK